jgi:hypothetical protein
MVPVRDLAAQAEVCAGCHVGRPARDGLPCQDVDHDLIAAGHPRLTFEFSAYLANMPPHWWQGRPPDSRPDFSAAAWAVGQVAAARSAVELLADRAGRSRPLDRAGPPGSADPKRNPPWPEFSEYGCYSCHHDLKDEPWRRGAGAASPPGSLTWGSWFLAPLETLAQAHLGAEADKALAPLREVRALMAARDPDANKVAARAADAEGALRAWVASDGLGLAKVRELRDRVAARTPRSWDEAAQRYLALVPLEQSLAKQPGRPDEATSAMLKALLDRLNFPAGHDSPRGFDPTAR